jgi:hypothetical protein
MLSMILPGYFILIVSYSFIELVEEDWDKDWLVRVGEIWTVIGMENC